MKKFFVLLTLVALAGAFAGCEGPAGADGADGTDGVDGLAGLAGADANETCKECHNSGEEITGRVAQYNVSGHATLGTAAYGNRSSCAQCHTSQGFVEFVAGVDITAPYATPNQPNCRTCHDIHNTFTVADWARRVTTPVISIQADDDVTTLADFGEGNICATCHQARSADIPAVDATALTDSTTMSSKRYGPHHGPQANVLDGTAGWQVAGTLSYATNYHKTVTDGCVGCHMADGGNYQMGGHTWKMETDFHGSTHLSDATCVATCHTGVDMEGKITTSMTAIDLLLVDLKALLDAKGYLDPDGYVADGGVAIGYSGFKVPSVYAGAIYNYRMIALEDGGYAAHNPTLAKALLTNSIAAINAL